MLKKLWARHSPAESLLWWFSLNIFSIRSSNSSSVTIYFCFKYEIIVDSPLNSGFIYSQFLPYCNNYYYHSHRSGVPANSNIFFNTWDSLLHYQSNGHRSSNSAAKQPTDQMSTFEEYDRTPSNSSGARYQRVTTFVVDNFFIFFARPKSAILRLS